MSSYVYILKCGDGSLYTGYTNNLEKRLKAHNDGIASKYTASHLPVEMVFSEECIDKSDALKKEHFIKTLTRKNKLKLIQNKLSLQNLYDNYLNK
ncbi:MAG: GIY-YIG nuclease family protein [Peptoniphilus sp.]|uniref:GIY-YIG nuclease family protein n=1 Tax=Peptoniphilus sp. TaxID=1971214 RepID=UPI0025E628BC|nr:GIY-YIG nuclease family protein [Peptoniphilus sp.]MCI5642656.1 GIY-YIG nuclease family protein [Peptoniphilus sp.]MDD7352742.1 GIY-YIG nuclease family protein [Peptoniphilaceae bacterium]MDY3903346.1 GIY-YIG nuclease family protein [Peptoniphilus sp.]